jgi:hypothetical protein
MGSGAYAGFRVVAVCEADPDLLKVTAMLPHPVKHLKFHVLRCGPSYSMLTSYWTCSVGEENAPRCA